MNWLLGNISLGVKLNVLVLLVLAVLLLSVIVLLDRNTQSLTEEVGLERAAEEANIIESLLKEVEEELLVETTFLATDVRFFQAVGRRDAADTREIVIQANVSLGLDDITVVDGDGRRLVDTGTVEGSAAEDQLLSLALDGTKTAALLVEEQSEVTISITAIAPVLSTFGNTLGAILLSRHVDEAFLQGLTFGRDGVHLGLVYQDEILVRTATSATDSTTAHDANVLRNDITFEPGSVSAAQSGETIILHNLTSGSRGVPHSIAYTPVLSSAEISPAVIMILIELEDIYSFQSSILRNTISIFVVLTLLALAISYINIYQTTIRPLNNLRTISQTMTSGQYDERAPVNTKDEVGQLAAAFNEMAQAIQQREMSLQIAREQAERADKVKSMFLASVSHELRTPLNAIINLTKFVAKGWYGPVSDEQTDILGKVEIRSKHLLNLINDVLEISKIEAGSLELFVEDNININDIIQSVVETGQSLLMGKPVEIIEDIEPNLPLLIGDEQRLRQIVLNLFSNACKFTEEGYIAVKAFRQEREIIISICDSGPGIDPSQHETIFEAFRQTTVGLRKAGGTGLGLAISKRLVEAHAGRLWVESISGQGATFYIALPIESSLTPTV